MWSSFLSLNRCYTTADGTENMHQDVASKSGISMEVQHGEVYFWFSKGFQYMYFINATDSVRVFCFSLIFRPRPVLSNKTIFHTLVLYL